MKLAITGSSGLVGRALVEHLKRAGHSVVHLVRSESAASDSDKCWWDPERGIQQPGKLTDIDACIHLAGRSIADHRWTKHEKELIRESRVDATLKLAADLVDMSTNRSRPLGKFISASAIGIYGDSGDQLVTEQSPPADDFLARTAIDWEAASQPLLQAGVRVCHARLGIVLDRQGGALAKMLPIFRWGLGANLGNGQQYWSWVLLADVVRAITWMLETPAADGAYNVTAPEPVTNAEFTRVLADKLKRTRFLPVPKLALRVMFGEMADAALLASCRAVPERLLQSGFEFQAATLAEALDVALE